MEKLSRSNNNSFHFTPAIILTVFMLLICGFIVLASAGMASDQSPVSFISKQGMFCLVGIIAAFICYRFPHRWMKSYTFFGLLYIGLLFSLFSVYLFGADFNNTRHVDRWVAIPGTSITFQPSELVKIGIVLLIAIWVSLNPQRIQKFFSWGGLLPIGTAISLLLALIFLEPDYATTLICGIVAMVTVYVGGASQKLVVTALIALVMIFGVTVTTFASERSARIRAHQNLWTENASNYTDENRQQYAAVYAIASGHLFGKGLGKGFAKLGSLSEHESDFIFATFAEEFGFIGSILVLAAFVFILYAGACISIQSNDLFSRVLAMGIVTLISFQVLLNLATTTALVPNTGLTFPFFSKGGTNLVIMLVSIGFLLGVERESRRSSVRTFVETKARQSAMANPFD